MLLFLDSLQYSKNVKKSTARMVSQYGVFSGPNFPVFSPNTGKYGPEKSVYGLFSCNERPPWNASKMSRRPLVIPH